MSSDDDVVIIDTSESDGGFREEEANRFSDSHDVEDSSHSSASCDGGGGSDLVHSDVVPRDVVRVDAGVNTTVCVEEDMERRLNENLAHLGESLATLKRPSSDNPEMPPSSFRARREKLQSSKRSRFDAMTKQEPFSPEEPLSSWTKIEDETPSWLSGLTDCLRRVEKASDAYFAEKDASTSAPCFLLSPIENCTALQHDAGVERAKRENTEPEQHHLRAAYDKLKEKLKCAEAILRQEGSDNLESIYGELQLLRQRSREAARSKASDAARTLSEQDLIFQELLRMSNSKHMYYSRKFFDRCSEPGEGVATLQRDLDQLVVFQRKIKEIVESVPSVAQAPRVLPVAAPPRLAGRSAEIVYQTLEKERVHLKHENEKLTQQLSNAQHDQRNLLAAFQLADAKDIHAKLTTLSQVIESCGEQRRKNMESIAASLGWAVQSVSANEVLLRHRETNEVRTVSLVEPEVVEKQPASFAELAAREVDLPPLPSDSEDLQSAHSGEEDAQTLSPLAPSQGIKTPFSEPEEEVADVPQEEEEQGTEEDARLPSEPHVVTNVEPQMTHDIMEDLPSLPSSSDDEARDSA